MQRVIIDDNCSIHFVTFSCYKKRHFLDSDRAKKIVIGVLGSQLTKQNGKCIGFVIMPEHVHALIWFPDKGQISHFMKQFKQRTSVQIKQFLLKHFPNYISTIDSEDPAWQAKYYNFNIYNEKKMLEKLTYMHYNPVKIGLVENPCDWKYSSALFYDQGKSVGIKVGW